MERDRSGDPAQPLGDVLAFPHENVLQGLSNTRFIINDEEYVGQAELILKERMALFDQPELSDPELLREIFSAVEAKERLVELLDRVLDEEGVSVSAGGASFFAFSGTAKCKPCHTPRKPDNTVAAFLRRRV